MTEEAFLRALQERPDDDATRLVFADWLEEQGDEVSHCKADFVRIDLKVASRPRRSPHPDLNRQRQELAQRLPSLWLAVVSKAPIELCRFRYECPLKWEQLDPIPHRLTERHCLQCDRNVTFCRDLDQARALGRRGACVALDPRLVRRSNDLTVPLHSDDDLVLGLIADL